eukprot:COSAG02_NODE_26196_length_638_cov_1.424861_2_plen_74_part_00
MMCIASRALGFALLSRMGCASFVALEPSDYRKHFVEGWPGPHDDGSGVGRCSRAVTLTSTMLTTTVQRAIKVT